MSNVLDSIISIQPPFNMVVLIVLISCAAGVVTCIGSEIRKYMCHREDVELKRDMLARGMSAHEIEQVVRAKSSNEETGDHATNMVA